MRVLFYMLSFLVLWSASGCTTWGSHSRKQAQAREDYLLFDEQVRRLSGRVESLEMENERLYRVVEDLRRDETQGALEDRVRKLEAALDQERTARARDKQETIDKLSKKITEVVSASARSGSSRKSSRRISDYGVEHTVETGQTLSEIASAYGVRVNVLIEANDLKNPNALRVGQKLFIPE